MAIEDQMSSSPPVTQALLAWAEYWYPISWKCLLIAGAITAIGACVTIAFLVLQWRTMSIRETQTEWRRSILEYQVADAKKQATDGLARVADLNVKTADLTLKNLYLSQMIQSRHLSIAQIHDIIRAWKEYSGRSVILWSYGMDIEGAALSEQIKKCLTGAHVVVVNNIGRMTTSAPAHIGIQIAGVDKRLVAAIHAGLHEIGGLEATEIELPADDGANAVPAEIFVGAKPLAQ
ncbi:MAG TPA: hypothetical protein VEF36_02075 [Roseiarcus sp.]|nr:hypothetical protein [Roseiarcus sp.]